MNRFKKRDEVPVERKAEKPQKSLRSCSSRCQGEERRGGDDRSEEVREETEEKKKKKTFKDKNNVKSEIES